jgi:hypothetical protein
MRHKEQLKNLLQTAAADLMYAERFSKSYMLKAQKIGLQGEKRRFRYESVRFHNLWNYLHCDFYDLFGSDLITTHTEEQIPTITNVSDFFSKVLDFSEAMYDKFHAAANAMMPAHGYTYACKLLEVCKCLAECIKYYRRAISEGNTSSWSDAYIQRLMLHQTTDCNVHDEYEAKEADVGYKF